MGGTNPRKESWGPWVKNLKIHNISLMHKWLWGFSQEEAALWRTVISAKYGLLNPWTTKLPSSSGASGIWRHIRVHWHSFYANLALKDGMGER